MALKSRERQQLWYQKSQRPDHQLHQGEKRPERLKDERSHFPSNVRGRGVVLLIASRTTAHASLIIITNKLAFWGERRTVATDYHHKLRQGWRCATETRSWRTRKDSPRTLTVFNPSFWPVCLVIFKKWVQILTIINFFPNNKKVSDWYDNYCAKW